MITTIRVRSVVSSRGQATLLAPLFIFSLLVGTLLVAPLSVVAQQAEVPAAPGPQVQFQLAGTRPIPLTPWTAYSEQTMSPAAPPPGLQIVILEGEDVSNNIKDRTAREPIVQVQDENHKPVAGATVLFTIQTGSGHAGASFANGARTFTGQTDANGNITAHGFHPNTHTGHFNVNVQASKGQLTTHTTIAQTNVAAATTAATTSTITAFVTTHVVVVAAVAAGVVAAGVTAGVVASQNSGTTITAGTGTVGAPQLNRGPGLTIHR